MHLVATWLAGGILAGAPLLLGGFAATEAEGPVTSPLLGGGIAALTSTEAGGELLYIRAGKLIVRPGEVLENAQVIVEDGVIRKVGRDLALPDGARELDAQVVCAGFIDPWSTMGLAGSSTGEQRSTASTRTADALDVYSGVHLREQALAAGVTCVRVQAGGGGTIGGLGALVRTTPKGADSASVLIEDAGVGLSLGAGKPDVFDRISAIDKVSSLISSGLKYREDHVEYRHKQTEWQAEIATSEAKLKKDFKKAKKSRDKAVKDAKEDGDEHKEKSYKEDKAPKKPKFDADKAVLAQVAHGEIPLFITMHRAAELRALLARTASFDRLRMVVLGGTESLAVAETLAERGIPVVLWVAPLGSSPGDQWDGHSLGLAAALHAKGVTVLLGSGGTATSHDLPRLAQLAIGHGLDRDTAFAALTLGAARALDCADRLGSVERGKDADLLLLDGDPLLTSTHLRYVVSGGSVVVTPED